MFLEIQQQMRAYGPVDVFDLHSSAITGLLEDIWAARYLETSGAYAMPPDERARARIGAAVSTAVRRAYAGIPIANGVRPGEIAQARGWPSGGTGHSGYDHLIFALCMETTNVYEIFAKVLAEFERGMALATLSTRGQNWLRRTRELFYTQQPPSSVLCLTSDINPDVRAARDRAYRLLFGFGIDHPTYTGHAFPKVDVTTPNDGFRSTLVALFQEIWRSYVNARNTSGPDDADPEAVRLLAQELYGGLTTSRRYGFLDQAEFASVAAMSWFYLTLQADTPIITDLQAQASTPWDRLTRLAARVGMPVHPHVRHLILLAESLSPLLRLTEAGVFNGGGVDALYIPDEQNQVWNLVDAAINALQVTMGIRIKGIPVMDTATTLPNGAHRVTTLLPTN